MVKLYFEKLAPGMNAKLDAKYRTGRNHHGVNHGRYGLRRPGRNGSINCLLADAVKMPYNRTQLS
ncbi:MAG: hypothetical protein ABID71_00465 [Chloroflexota bacterium]